MIEPTKPLASQAKHVQHVKRGSIYEIIQNSHITGKIYKEGDMVPVRIGMGRPLYYAEFQHSGARLTTYSTLVIYRCILDRKYWCRELNEFNDGRFVIVDEIPKPNA